MFLKHQWKQGLGQDQTLPFQELHASKFIVHTDLLWVCSVQPEGEELEEEAGAGLVVQCDAVIVGSGAGAGPVSALLAEAGLKVVLLEKANFTPTQELSLTVSSYHRAVLPAPLNCT